MACPGNGWSGNALLATIFFLWPRNRERACKERTTRRRLLQSRFLRFTACACDDGPRPIQAGAGIVYDLDPALEWEETMNKGRALFRAVAQAAKGL